MELAELQEILESDKPLNVKQVQEIIYQLKNDCFDEIYKFNNEQKEIETIKPEQSIDVKFQTYLKEKFYYGEINAFYICLDLLEKVIDRREKFES
jgi:hypothetical protein